MRKLAYLILGALVLAGCTTSTPNKQNSNPTTSATTNAETAATGEYLGFEIITFRSDPYYFDETEEYIEIEWLGPGTVNMQGYRLIVESNDDEYTYTFPAVSLEAGERITVYGRAGAGQFNFGARGEIFDNDYSSVNLYDTNDYLEAYYGF